MCNTFFFLFSVTIRQHQRLHLVSFRLVRFISFRFIFVFVPFHSPILYWPRWLRISGFSFHSQLYLYSLIYGL